MPPAWNLPQMVSLQRPITSDDSYVKEVSLNVVFRSQAGQNVENFPVLKKLFTIRRAFRYLCHAVTRATPPTRETRVTRLAGRVKILLLFWILPRVFVQCTTRAF